jgi:hypothetical protein
VAPGGGQTPFLEVDHVAKVVAIGCTKGVPQYELVNLDNESESELTYVTEPRKREQTLEGWTRFEVVGGDAEFTIVSGKSDRRLTEIHTLSRTKANEPEKGYCVYTATAVEVPAVRVRLEEVNTEGLEKLASLH